MRHDLSIRQHIRNAARHSQVVLQYGKLTAGKTDEVGTDYRSVYVVGDPDTPHLPLIILATVNEFERYSPFLQYSSLVVDISQEEIDGVYALAQATLDCMPFLFAYDTGKDVVGEDAFNRGVFAIYGESDAPIQKRQVGCLLTLCQFAGLQYQNTLKQLLVRGSRTAVPLKHLVEDVAVQSVTSEKAECILASVLGLIRHVNSPPLLQRVGLC